MKRNDNDIVTTRKSASSAGLVILMLFLLAAFIMGGIVVARYLLPSLAIEVAASQIEAEFNHRVVEPTVPAVGTGSVVTITFSELLAHNQEIYRHDEAMNQAALDAVVEVAKSGDVA